MRSPRQPGGGASRSSPSAETIALTGSYVAALPAGSAADRAVIAASHSIRSQGERVEN